MAEAERATIDLVETLETSGELPKYIDQDALIKETLNEALALGPLEDLFADENIDEIIIDRRDRVVVGKNGQLRGSGKAFSSDDVFERVVKRLVHEAGARDRRSAPGRRPAHARRHAAHRRGRSGRGARRVPRAQEAGGARRRSSRTSSRRARCPAAWPTSSPPASPRAATSSCAAARARARPRSSARSRRRRRRVSASSPIEDVAELAIGARRVDPARDASGDGKSHEVDLATLLDTALRLMPDRLVVGEVRGREAMPLVQALNSSVDGAVVGDDGRGRERRAQPARDARARDAAASAPTRAIRELVATAFEIVVHVGRGADGNVKVHSIEEVSGVSDTHFETEAVFSLKDGSFAATGKVPRFYTELGARPSRLPLGHFSGVDTRRSPSRLRSRVLGHRAAPPGLHDSIYRSFDCSS